MAALSPAADIGVDDLGCPGTCGRACGYAGVVPRGRLHNPWVRRRAATDRPRTGRGPAYASAFAGSPCAAISARPDAPLRSYAVGGAGSRGADTLIPGGQWRRRSGTPSRLPLLS